MRKWPRIHANRQRVGILCYCSRSITGQESTEPIVGCVFDMRCNDSIKISLILLMLASPIAWCEPKQSKNVDQASSRWKQNRKCCKMMDLPCRISCDRRPSISKKRSNVFFFCFCCRLLLLRMMTFIAAMECVTSKHTCQTRMTLTTMYLPTMRFFSSLCSFVCLLQSLGNIV